MTFYRHPKILVGKDPIRLVQAIKTYFKPLTADIKSLGVCFVLFKCDIDPAIFATAPAMSFGF